MFKRSTLAILIRPHEKIRLGDAVAAETDPVLDLHLGVSAVDAAVVAVVVDVARHPDAGVVDLERFQLAALRLRDGLWVRVSASAQICKLLSVRSPT